MKQLQEIRGHKIRTQRQKREIEEKKSNSPKRTLEELKEKHIALLQGELSVSKRGYGLEVILRDLCKLSNLEVTEPFRAIGEQIDGAV